MECSSCGREVGVAKFCRYCGAAQSVQRIDAAGGEEQVNACPGTDFQPASPANGQYKKSGVSYKALFIGVSSVFALALVLVATTLYTAKTWTKVDVPEHKETFHNETYKTGAYSVTMDSSDPCWINQRWSDCINLHVNEYNRECANRSLTSSASSLCSRYSDMIDDMKARDGGWNWYVTSLGTWGRLRSTEETAIRKVSNNDYRPAVTHEATCYWGGCSVSAQMSEKPLRVNAKWIVGIVAICLVNAALGAAVYAGALALFDEPSISVAVTDEDFIYEIRDYDINPGQTLVLYTNYACPFCAALYEQMETVDVTTRILLMKSEAGRFASQDVVSPYMLKLSRVDEEAFSKMQDVLYSKQDDWVMLDDDDVLAWLNEQAGQVWQENDLAGELEELRELESKSPPGLLHIPSLYLNGNRVL